MCSLLLLIKLKLLVYNAAALAAPLLLHQWKLTH